jgi:hypothetical protein
MMLKKKREGSKREDHYSRSKNHNGSDAELPQHTNASLEKPKGPN